MSGILPDTGNVESEVHIHSLSLGKDKFNFSNKELVESSWKSPSQQRREEKRKLEHPKIKVAEKGAESDVGKGNTKVCKEVSGKETKTSFYAGKAPDVKAAKEIDLSKESHTEEVEAEKTVTLKNSIIFECELCSYRNNSENGQKQHKRTKHRISQTDGADDHGLEESEIPVRSAEEMKKGF